MRDKRSLEAAVKGLADRSQSQAELIETLQQTNAGLSEHATSLELKLSSLEGAMRQSELTNYEDTVKIADLREALSRHVAPGSIGQQSHCHLCPGPITAEVPEASN